MNRLDIIKKPVATEIDKFEEFFRNQVKSDVPLLNVVLNYMLRSKGKQMRPLFVFLAAKMHGEINRRTFLAATSIELIHSATLIHDDVVDESYKRRGLFSINALWKNKISVLVGDFILAKGLLIATKEREYVMLELISEAVKNMSEGELLQHEKSRKLDIDEAVYYEIISKKTASLIAASMSIGTLSVSDDCSVRDKMYEIGRLIGIAFQIKDDILDYQQANLIGKPTGNDIKEKKITLPLLYVLKNSSVAERKQILTTLRRRNNNNNKVNDLIQLVRNKGGIEYATLKMNEFCTKAKLMLNEFAESEAREAMSELIDYAINRKK